MVKKWLLVVETELSNVSVILSFFSCFRSQFSWILRFIWLVWDTRSFKKPLYVSSTPLPSLNPETNLIFSPDERYLLTGTAGAQAGVLVGTAEEQKLKEAMKGEGGKVVVLKTEGLDVVRSLSEFRFISFVPTNRMLIYDFPQLYHLIQLFEYYGILKSIKCVFTRFLLLFL